MSTNLPRLREFAYLLAYVVLFSSLVPLLGLIYKRKQHNILYKSVTLVILSFIVADLISYFTHLFIGSNHFSAHITNFLNALPIFLLFYLVTYKKKEQSLQIVLFGFYLILLILDIFWTAGLYNYNWLSRVYLCLVFSASAVHVLIGMKFTANNPDLSKQPMFWFCMAILSYYLSVSILEFSMHLATELPMNLLFALHISKMCLLLLSRAFWTIGIFVVPAQPSR